MKTRYQRWMHNWETRMTSRDNNRVVRPLEWGVEWAQRWPVVGEMEPAESHISRRQGYVDHPAHGAPHVPNTGLCGAPGELDNSRRQALSVSAVIPSEVEGPVSAAVSPAMFDTAAMIAWWKEVNRRIIERSDEFYTYRTPADFHLEHRKVELFHTGSEPPKKQPRDEHAHFLRFTSAVESPYPENNRMNARWFPARGHRAVVVLPQWNADGVSHNGLCRIFNKLGIAALRMSMPYHDIRRPEGLTRADYAVSANIGRTIDAVRQGIADIRSCLDWLEQRGYTRLGIVGTSLGSCYAFLAGAHDPRIKVSVFNHASTAFGDVVWTGQSTRHIRQGFEGKLTHDDVRDVWMAISPIVYFDKFQRWPKKSLMIYGRYDLTFLPEFSMQAAGEFLRRGLDTTIKALPCGHYSLGETPYKYMDAWHISRFLAKAFAG